MATNSETDALIELLVQLKKIVGTVPDQAKLLLTSKPPLAYSLVQLMVKMNILSPEALQKTLSFLPALPQPTPPVQPTPPPVPSQPHTLPVIANGNPQPMPGFKHYLPPPQQLNGQPQTPQLQPPAPAYHPSPQAPGYPPPSAQAMFSAMPEDQKNMIMQVLSYTPEQISQLAPTDRATFIQLRATFGIIS